MLVIEKYDQKSIYQRYFLEYDWMFKVALYGNVLDFNLLKRLQSHKNRLIDYIDNEIIFGGAGIHKGTKSEYKPFISTSNPQLNFQQLSNNFLPCMRVLCLSFVLL